MRTDPLTVIYFSRTKSGCSMFGKLFFAAIFGGIALLTSGWVMWVTGIIGGFAALAGLISLYQTVVRPAVLEMRPAGHGQRA